MKIIQEELKSEESLKQRLEFICEFSKVTIYLSMVALEKWKELILDI